MFWVLVVVIAAAGVAEWQAQKRIITRYEKSRDHWVRVAGEATKERKLLLSVHRESVQELGQARMEMARLRRLLMTSQDKETVQTEWIHHLWAAGLVPGCRGVPLDSALGAEWRR